MTDTGTDRSALLELHARERSAHLSGDADLLTAAMSDHVWEASRGGLNRLPREDIRSRFRAYFAQVRYDVWDDLEPPHVSVSTDAMSAWMAIAIEARMTVRDEQGEERDVAFESSWISTWDKIDGEWRMTGISSSVVERG